MSRNRRRLVLALALLAVTLFQAPLAFACGPFSLGAIFAFRVHPEFPLEKFAAGEIGVVRPSYARSYLYVAYKYFNGGRFSPAEQAAVVELWRDRLEHRGGPDDLGWIKTWLDARQKVIAGTPPGIDVYRSREKPNDYETFINCQQDAFENAATTLGARIKKFGPESAATKQWVEAQDQVFANCSEGQHIPAALPSEADALLRADRDYQIASANFYAGNFELSKSQFESIAADGKSPWRGAAPYLVARALIRKASLGPAETKQASLAEAEQRLSKILSFPPSNPTHAAVKRLLNIARIRLHPEEKLGELGLMLASKPEAETLKQDLWDYTILLDQFAGDGEAHHQGGATSPAVLHGDDLTDWLVTFQSDKAETLDYALTRWQATSSVPWLLAALSKVQAGHAKAAALQDAAAKIPPSSPAFATAAFLSVRLDIAAGRAVVARTKLDDLLKQHRSHFNLSSLNLLQEQRMTVATSLDDLLTYAQRMPAGFSWGEDDRELPVDAAELGEEGKPFQAKPLFDTDVAEVFNRRMPVSLLSQASANNRLAEHLRRDVTQAAWLRAVLLGDVKTATALVPTLKTMVPEMSPLLDEYAGAVEPGAKKFAAIYAWLKFPGLEPVVDTGVGRGTLNERDSYRDNWWCSAALSASEPGTTEGEPEAQAPQRPIPFFLTPAQRATADREFAALAALGAAPNYLCRQVLEWATKHPTDPRVPEALHLAVSTTRYGCTDKQTGRWSKAAHDFLHRRYPNNPWTKQTPYWFKE
ncbi:MAG TPA: hypothetical protein VMS31_07090 [Pyrinomonadaceae bacterium]|nr:hypothetical protein [Pyrinomonadaceae bacterium]